MFKNCLVLLLALIVWLVSVPKMFAQESPSNIQGGGSRIGAIVYEQLFSTFNQTQPNGGAIFNNYDADFPQSKLYFSTESPVAQGFLFSNNLNSLCLATTNDQLNCLGGTLSGGINSVHYATSAVSVTPDQWSAWQYQNPYPGHLMQIPLLGVGVAFSVVNAGVIQNGADAKHKAIPGGIVLTPDDLCGIFSGKMSDWSQTSAYRTVAPGQIQVYYLSVNSELTFLLTQHLSAICTQSNSNFIHLPVIPSTNFFSLFPSGYPPVPSGSTVTNFFGERGIGSIADDLSNEGVFRGVASAIGYLTPDLTTINPNSDSHIPATGLPSRLVVAALGNCPTCIAYIPSSTDIAVGLEHGKIFNPANSYKPPRTSLEGASPLAWLPLIEDVSEGYPVVGYAAMNLAQCYRSAQIGAAMNSFLTTVVNSNSSQTSIIIRNGFAPLTQSAKQFVKVINETLLSNKLGWYDNIGNPTACYQYPGR